MTKMIHHTLDLPEMEDVLVSDEIVEDEDDLNYEELNQSNLDMTVALAEQAERTLELKNGDGHAQSMDDLHKETLQHARDLMDLGFNVDQRSAATIFEKAVMLYKAATDAKNSKRDMQLKAMKLMLDSRKLDLEEKRLNHELGQNVVDAEGTVVEDRNEMIRRIREQSK
jgi:hypothetical protein